MSAVSWRSGLRTRADRRDVRGGAGGVARGGSRLSRRARGGRAGAHRRIHAPAPCLRDHARGTTRRCSSCWRRPRPPSGATRLLAGDGPDDDALAYAGPRSPGHAPPVSRSAARSASRSNTRCTGSRSGRERWPPGTTRCLTGSPGRAEGVRRPALAWRRAARHGAGRTASAGSDTRPSARQVAAATGFGHAHVRAPRTAGRKRAGGAHGVDRLGERLAPRTAARWAVSRARHPAARACTDGSAER